METNNDLKEKISQIAKKVVDISLYILALLTAFVIGFYSNQLSQQYQAKPDNFSKPLTSTNISIAVTERNELLIIDRAKQTIQVYQDSIGLMIFKSYANRITNEIHAK